MEEPTKATPQRQSAADLDNDRASTVVFGATKRAAINTGDVTVSYAPGKLAGLRSNPFFIAAGDASPSAHPDPGYIGIWYLRRTPDSFVVVKSYPNIVAIGSFGAAPEWKIRQDLGADPVMEATGFGMWFGHAYTCTSLVALGQRGPRVLIRRVLTGYEFDPGDDAANEEPAANFVGDISYDAKRDEFTIRYDGTEKGSVKYGRRGAGYERLKQKWAPSKSC